MRKDLRSNPYARLPNLQVSPPIDGAVKKLVTLYSIGT